ncbi:MAG: hypothetical protein ACI959_001093 [Limisphaerales bacterium]|jgi:hypothetical protein
MRLTNSIYLLLILCLSISVNAQQTLGVFKYDSLSFEGYSLFAPTAYSSTYLIDNCGREINSWPGSSTPGLSAYLLPSGHLLRTSRIISSLFLGGGAGGLIEKKTWDGILVWKYEYLSDRFQQHHDIEYLANGNILLLSWDYITGSEAIAAGRDPSLIGAGTWAERITEIEPIGTDSANIVWEWVMMDHIVQDFNPVLPNFGVVAEHPEKFNLNWVHNPTGSDFSDWIHANSVSYNPERDEIIFSSHNFSEVWIIDHSTTTAEAATSTGGNSGNGGDILYRYGNPQTYDRGTAADQVFFQQHDAQWITLGEDSGKLMVFNNGVGRPFGNSSSIDIWEPVLDGSDNYETPVSDPFGPDNLIYQWTADPLSDFYSKNVGGVQIMPNGNFLICEGAEGRVFETDRSGIIHWEYEVPVGLSGPLGQGVPAVNNQTFRMYRYAPDYPGLVGTDLTPGKVIELNPTDTSCSVYTPPLSTALNEIPDQVLSPAFPNPFQQEIWIPSGIMDDNPPQLYNLQGQFLLLGTQQGRYWHFNTAELSSGIYLLRQGNKSWKVIKNGNSF